MRGRRAVLVVLALAVAAFLLWPSPIDPLPFTPGPMPPLAGPLAPNGSLAAAARVSADALHGAEDLAFDADGTIVTGTRDGRLWRVSADGRATEIASTGGRPLGLVFDASGGLLVCDERRGLLRMGRDGRIETLADTAAGVRMGLADAADVAPDGTVYLSDASTRFAVHDSVLDLLEGRPHGRLIAWDQASRAARVVLDGLYFANGVVLAADGSYVLVNETFRYRVRRLWLTGPKAGRDDVFADGLPGLPDGISRSPRGTYWVSIFAVRDVRTEGLQPRPWAKSLLAKVPRALWAHASKHTMVLELDGEGRILRSLDDTTGQVANVTSVRERDGALLLGNLEGRGLARVKLP